LASTQSKFDQKFDWRWLVLLSMCVWAILFLPYLNYFERLPNARLIDVNFKPITNYQLFFPDGSETRSDKHGRFELPAQLYPPPATIDGMTLVGTAHHSGGNPFRTYTYSPTATYEFVIENEDDRFDPKIDLFQIQICAKDKIETLGMKLGKPLRVEGLPAAIHPQEFLVKSVKDRNWQYRARSLRTIENGVIRITIPAPLPNG